MAMAICSSSSSSSKHSPAFPNISFSSYSTKSYLKISSYASPNSTSNFNCSTLQEDAHTISNAGIQHLTGAVTASLEKILSESGVESEHRWRDEAAVRRKRRRKLRSVWECNNDEEDEKLVFVDKKTAKSRFMTPKEEARFSSYLKERARIEDVRKELLSIMEGNEVNSTEWAKAAGISQHKLDRIYWNGRESQETITSCYRRLVVSVASSYQGRGLCLQDLTQEGSIGLLRGATKFNPERGYKLSTYAYWWIRQAITRALAKKSKLIRLPGSISELVPKICEANNALSRSLRRFPTYDEIAEAIDANPSSVRLAIERNRSPISLDQAMNSQGSMSLQDIIPGPDEITPESMVKRGVLKPKIEKLLKKCLCDREADIVRLHYGLNGESPWSFEEIGRLFKLSRERVRQINTGALLKLQQTSDIDDLKYFIS